VRDTSTSSEFKGESQEDSVRTFSSYFDLIIMRTPRGGWRSAWPGCSPTPSAGADHQCRLGKDQHPTQALLDIYTLQRSFEQRGGIDGKTVMFVGDLAARAHRALAVPAADELPRRPQVFVAPDRCRSAQDITGHAQGRAWRRLRAEPRVRGA
jgi:aspartate carbamoyltransferase catalytic subunit